MPKFRQVNTGELVEAELLREDRTETYGVAHIREVKVAQRGEWEVHGRVSAWYPHAYLARYYAPVDAAAQAEFAAGERIAAEIVRERADADLVTPLQD
jgi:hypothetical protein